MGSVFAKLLYTGKDVTKKVYISFKGKSVSAVSAKKPKGRLLGSYPVVTPAFIDPHSHIGMRRAGEPGSEGESNDYTDNIIPVPDALDSVQLDDPSFAQAVEMGVCYSCVVPGSGNVIGGRSAIIRHYAPDTSAALIGRAGIKSAYGYNTMSGASHKKGTRPTTRMGNLAQLRQKLDSVLQKINKQERSNDPDSAEVEFSLEERILKDILLRKERLRCHVHKIDDIAALLRVRDEFDLDISVEHACDVHEPGIYQELKKRKIPVFYGPVDAFAYKTELKHESWRNVRYLIDSGVTFGLITDHPVTPARQLLLQTRWFLRLGYSKQEAIELITRRNAELLGLSKRLGSIAKGKWASLVCWNGDPFSLASYPRLVIAEGQEIYSA